MTSLAELRAIEQERILADAQAIVAAREARVQAAADAERAERERAAARLAAERAAELAQAEAEAAAERDAWAKVQAIEAAERARLAAAIEQARVDEELALRRAEVARTRPRWMVAVTMLSMVAVAMLAWFAIDRKIDADRADAEAQAAQVERDRAREASQRAVAALASMEGELGALDDRVGKAIIELDQARDAEARARVKAELRRTLEEKAELERRRAAARQAAELAARRAGLVVSEECKRNPLARGCT